MTPAEIVAKAIFATAYQERWKEFWAEESLRTGFYEMADAALDALDAAGYRVLAKDAL